MRIFSIYSLLCLNFLISNFVYANNLCNNSNALPSIAQQAASLRELALATMKPIEKLPCRTRAPNLTQMESWLKEIQSKEPAKSPIPEFFSGDLPQNIDSAKYNLCEKDFICQAKILFGEAEAIQILYLKLKFNLNASHYIDSTTQAWKAKELAPLIQGIEDMHPELRKHSEGREFTRALCGTSIDKKNDTNALDSIRFFDHLFLKHPHDRHTRTTYHEMSHNIGANLKLDNSAEWFATGGWKALPEDKWTNNKPNCFASKYGRTDPGEDFAESMVAFRYNAAKFKKICPAKFNFIKEKVFKGLDYTTESACQRQIE